MKEYFNSNYAMEGNIRKNIGSCNYEHFIACWDVARRC